MLLLKVQVAMSVLAALVQDIDSSKNALEGKHLIVSASHMPPGLFIHRDTSGNVTGYSGQMFEHLKWLSARLKFSYSISPSPGNIAGIKINGTWNGLIGQLVRNEVDLGVFSFMMNFQRYEAMDYVGFVGGDDVCFLVKYPVAEYSSWAVFLPFTATMWIYWVTSTMVVVFTCWLFVRLRFKITGRSADFDDMVMYIIGTISCQDSFLFVLEFMSRDGVCIFKSIKRLGPAKSKDVINIVGGYYRKGHKSLGVLAVTWSLVAFVFVHVYSSTLFSNLSVIYKAPAINTIAQLASRSDYELAMLKGGAPEFDILDAKSGNFRILGDRLRKCEPCRMAKFEEVVPKVLEPGSKFVGLFTRYAMMAQIQADYERAGRCRLTMAYQTYGWTPMYFGTPKSSPYKVELTQQSLWTYDLGLYRKWKNDEPFPRQCLLKYNKRGVAVETITEPRLKLEQFYGAFLLLFTGYLAAILTLVVEKIHKKRMNRSKCNIICSDVTSLVSSISR